MTPKVNPKTAADRLRRLSKLAPRLAIVLGTGFQSVARGVEVDGHAAWHSVPGFPKASVPGHGGRVLVGTLQHTPVLILCGRAHYYEGHSMAALTFPIRALAEYGIESVLLTNAAGGINPRFRVGDFMVFRDHISLLPDNPLRGAALGPRPRFVDLCGAYDSRLARQLKAAARHAGARSHMGVYLAVPGPSYETPAEIRAFARLGADVVGMSTVPEVLVARQCGLRVAALSLVTNLAAGRTSSPLLHEGVLAAAAHTAALSEKMIGAFAAHYE